MHGDLPVRCGENESVVGVLPYDENGNEDGPLVEAHLHTIPTP